MPQNLSGHRPRNLPEEVNELMLWPNPFWDLNVHRMKLNLEI